MHHMCQFLHNFPSEFFANPLPRDWIAVGKVSAWMDAVPPDTERIESAISVNKDERLVCVAI